MSDRYLLSIDPGKSSGIALLGYDEDKVWLVKGWQVPRGVDGLLWWHSAETYRFDAGLGLNALWPDPIYFGAMHVITEKFTARNLQGFSYTTDSLEPLRGEGALIALGLMPDYTPQEKRWRDPKLQYVVGGKDKADKKKRLHKFLKDRGFYVTGGMLGAADADDARSAIGHGLAYIARELKHKPTFELISSWEG